MNVEIIGLVWNVKGVGNWYRINLKELFIYDMIKKNLDDRKESFLRVGIIVLFLIDLINFYIKRVLDIQDVMCS